MAARNAVGNDKKQSIDARDDKGDQHGGFHVLRQWRSGNHVVPSEILCKTGTAKADWRNNSAIRRTDQHISIRVADTLTDSDVMLLCLFLIWFVL